MSIQHLNLNAISESDLNRLVLDSVPEGKILEFKENLVIVTDDQKREFLSDITALANTDGGDLVLGMKADKGVAVDLIGLKNLSPDDAKNKIENLLRDSVQPRIMGCQLRELLLQNGNHVLIVRVPRSFAAPHMVRHQGISRFCGRNSAGKYDLDVHELRSSFLASETLGERLKSFRLDRVNKLISGNTPVPLKGQHLMVLHLLPVVGSRPEARLSTNDLKPLLNDTHLMPMGSSGYSRTFNFDGFLAASPGNGKPNHSYVQLLRSGFLESVDCDTLEPVDAEAAGTSTLKNIYHHTLEERLIYALANHLDAFKDLQLPPPYVLSVSLLNVKGYAMKVNPAYRFTQSSSHPIDRDHLLSDEVVIESATEKPDRVLRPLLDQIWNACGWPHSINFDSQGDWKPNG